MQRLTGAGALRVWLAALAWLVTSQPLVSGAAESRPRNPQSLAVSTGNLPESDQGGELEEIDEPVVIDELEEVFVEGRRLQPKPRTNKELQKPFDWLARLVGEFDIEGTIDLYIDGQPEDELDVTGRADCIGFGVAPAVQCDLRVVWEPTWGAEDEEIPGGVSTFNPAAILFGFEPVLPGVSFILVDSKGHAETAVGEMPTPDTMRASTKCFSTAGSCERLMQITADPDFETIEMKVLLRIKRETAARFTFMLRRTPDSVAVVYGRKEDSKENRQK